MRRVARVGKARAVDDGLVLLLDHLGEALEKRLVLQVALLGLPLRVAHVRAADLGVDEVHRHADGLRRGEAQAEPVVHELDRVAPDPILLRVVLLHVVGERHVDPQALRHAVHRELNVVRDREHALGAMR